MKARLPRCGSIHEQGAAIVTDNSKSYPSIQREGVVGVIQQQERFLVIRRSAHVVAPGKLCFPGGGIEAGESQPVALCRELMEEIAVEIIPGEKLWESIGRSNTRVHWWSAVITGNASPCANPKEVESIFWMTRKELLAQEDLLPGNRDFLNRL